MTPEQIDQVIVAIGDALAENNLTVDELSDEVVARTGSWAGDLVMPAFQTNWPRWRQTNPAAANAGGLLRTESRPQSHLLEPASLHSVQARERRDRAFCALEAVPPLLWTGNAGSRSRSGSAARLRSSATCSPRWQTNWRRSPWTASPPGWSAVTRNCRTTGDRRTASSVLRCVRRRQPSPRTPLPGQGLGTRSRRGTGRQLSAPADRRHRRWGLAPAQVRSQGAGDCRTARRTQSVTTTRPRRRGDQTRRDPRRRTRPDHRRSHRRRPRLGRATKWPDCWLGEP